tara:strand:- start:3029 stop:3487 length:459 start_codon:yes stop_codon:yes gene_type:complete
LARFASGNRAYGISDRSGFRYRLKDMKKEWNGLLVGVDEFEPKHPQLFPKRRIVDPQTLRNPRPETNLEAERNVTYGYNPVGSPTQPYFPTSKTEALGQVGSVQILVNGENDGIVTGVQATTSVGSVTVSSATSFDSTSITLDATTNTFDEG